jgi:hypothetical protein
MPTTMKTAVISWAYSRAILASGVVR